MALRQSFALGLGLGIGLLAISATRPAAAPPAGDAKAPGLSAAARKQYSGALKRGRQLEEKHDWQGAISAFGECLKLIPDDPWALSELGWAAYNAKQLELAEKSTRAAIAAAIQDDVKGASYYNLGLILEGRGDKTGAIAAYVASVKARGNAAVRSRLKALDASAAAALEPLAPTAMPGPVLDLKSFCRGWLTEAKKREDKEDARPCYFTQAPQQIGGDIEVTESPNKHAATKTAPPYLDVRVIAAGCKTRKDNPRGPYYVQAHLALRTEAGWFVEKLVEIESNHYCESSLYVEQLGVSDVIPGDRPEVSVRWSERGACRLSSTHPSEWRREFLGIAGIGPSQKPSMTQPIKLVDSKSAIEIEDGEPESELKDRTLIDVKLRAQFGKDGTLQLTGKTTGLDRATAAELIGEHTLRFP